MPIGNASIKRATGAIAKTGEKTAKNTFRADMVLSEIDIAKIKGCAEGSAPAELVKSVKKYGILHPVFVLCEKDSFQLIAGKARLQAAKEAGLDTVKAIVLTLEGTGAQTAKKDIAVRYSRSAVAEELAIASAEPEKLSDIHEEKFNAIRSIGSDLPDYLL